MLKTCSPLGLFPSPGKRQSGSNLQTQKVILHGLSSLCSHCLKSRSCLDISLHPFCCPGRAVLWKPWPQKLHWAPQKWQQRLSLEEISFATRQFPSTALLGDVKRSKECTLDIWGLTSRGYQSVLPMGDHSCQPMDQNIWKISVQVIVWSKKHCQESTARNGEGLLEKGKTLPGKKVIPQYPSQYVFGGQGSKRLRLARDHSFQEKHKRGCKGLRGWKNRCRNNLMHLQIRKAQSLSGLSRSSNAYDISLK